MWPLGGQGGIPSPAPAFGIRPKRVDAAGGEGSANRE